MAGRNNSRMSKWTAWVVTALAVVLASGCGGEGATGSAGEPKAPEQQAAATEKITQTLQDAFGEVEVPVNPRRVTALYREDFLVALGVKPVVQYYNPMFGNQDYLKLDVPLFDVTGSIEALLVTETDLIIGGPDVDAAKYEVFSKVAPTFRLQDDVLADTRKTLLKIGELLGMKEKAEQVIKDYDARIADVKNKLKTAVGSEKVVVLRMNVADKSINIFGIRNGFVGQILYQDLGLKAPAYAEKMTEANIVLSMEAIPELDADHIILLPSNGTWEDEGTAKALKDMLDNPIWKTVPAVKNGKVYPVERSYWQTGGITANGMKMDDLLKFLAP